LERPTFGDNIFSTIWPLDALIARTLPPGFNVCYLLFEKGFLCLA
jgi:hypothetical protein